MADQVADQHEEGTEAVENKSSLSYMMEHPDETSDPASFPQAQETQEAEEVREAAEAETAPAAADGSKEETPEQKAARVIAETEADKTKDWTVEDFRKGYKEAETRMHEATGETSKEKTAREAAEARAEAAETKLAEQEAERERLAAEAAKPKPVSEDEQDVIIAKAVAELTELDSTDEHYHRDYGRILRKIADLGKVSAGPNPDEIVNQVLEKVQATQKAEAAKTAEDLKRENDERLNREANDFAKQSGLDMTPGSADYRLFWDIAHNDLGNQEFMKGDTPPVTKDQFKWVTDEAKRLKGQVVTQTDEERRLAKLAQNNNKVMGKGVDFTPSREKPKTKTLSEMY